MMKFAFGAGSVPCKQKHIMSAENELARPTTHAGIGRVFGASCMQFIEVPNQRSHEGNPFSVSYRFWDVDPTRAQRGSARFDRAAAGGGGANSRFRRNLDGRYH